MTGGCGDLGRDAMGTCDRARRVHMTRRGRDMFCKANVTTKASPTSQLGSCWDNDLLHVSASFRNCWSYPMIQGLTSY